MALDRWVSFIILCAALAYGYAAFFTMDASLPPFMQRNPIWPSTFPKVLAVLTIATSLFGLELRRVPINPFFRQRKHLTAARNLYEPICDLVFIADDGFSIRHHKHMILRKP